MNPTLQQDLQDIENILEQVKQHGIEFLNSIDAVPTSTKNTIDTTGNLNDSGVGSLSVLEIFKQR